MYLKSTTMPLFKLRSNRYDLGLSNDLLFIIIAQEGARLWPVKVGGLKKILARRNQIPFYKEDRGCIK